MGISTTRSIRSRTCCGRTCGSSVRDKHIKSPANCKVSLDELNVSLYAGYRNTVSADLQQLASHVIWMNDLWPDVKMPGGTPANGRAPAARNESEDDEDGEVSDRGHDAPLRYQRKRTKDRKVQVTSQKAPPPSTAAPNDRQRRDRSRSRPRGGPQLQPADKDPGNLPLAALTVVSAQPALPQPPAKPSHYGPSDAPPPPDRRVLHVKRKRNGTQVSDANPDVVTECCVVANSLDIVCGKQANQPRASQTRLGEMPDLRSEQVS